VSLVKAVYAVRHGVIPPTAHFARPHPDVELDASPFTVPTATRDWPGPRRAGVSSFGLGGTNAHVLVEPAPPRPAPAPAPQWSLLPLCAADPGALRHHAERLGAHLAETPTAAVADVAYTLGVGRRRLPDRAAVVCRDAKEAVAALVGIAEGRSAPVPAEAPGALRDAAEAWLAGGEAPVAAGRRVPLPGYPFQRRRHWIDPVGVGVRP